jgi:hypothetical protein
MGYAKLITEVSPDNCSFGATKIGSTAGLIVPLRDSRRSVLLQNLSANDIYVGGSTVTMATGIKVAPAEDITIYTRAPLYAISANEGNDLRYLEEYHG